MCVNVFVYMCACVYVGRVHNIGVYIHARELELMFLMNKALKIQLNQICKKAM